MKNKQKKIRLAIKEYDYVDSDLLCVKIQDDRGIVYSGTLEKEEK